MLTKSLARELGPDLRVNAIAPGMTLETESNNALDNKAREQLLNRNALKKMVDPQDIANAVLFFIQQQSTTGQVLNIDCGRLLRC